MASATEHKMGEPTLEGQPLQYGEAKRLNDLKTQMAPAAPAEPVGEDRSPPQGVDLSGPSRKDNESFAPANEDEAILYGPTERPGETFAATRSSRARRPQGLEKFLPDLARAAAEPDAPQELRDFMEILAYHLGR
jgi:hypothetical protein